MGNISGTNVAASIVPFTTEDTFPTHESIYGKGGWREVDLESDKDAISEARRSVGMAVYVRESKKVYILTAEGTWEEFKAGSSGGGEGSGITQEDLDKKADKATTLAGYGIQDAYTKEEIDNKIGSVYKYKGSVENYDALPKDDNVVGDVYNVEDSGANYAWTGVAWDKLSETVDLSSYALKSELPTKVSQLQNDSNFITEIPEEYVTNTELTEAIAGKADSDSLSTVATTGSYNDLTDKPTIPEEYTLPIASVDTLGGIKIGSGLNASEDGTVNVDASTANISYDSLQNKPQINNIELTGNKSLEDLGIQAAGDYATSEDVASAVAGKADKSTTLAGYGITDAYTKTEIDGKLGSVYKYKGSVANEAALPQDSQTIGDVYNVEDTGANYAWNGTSWDKLSETIDLSSYATKEDLKAGSIAYTNGEIKSVQEALDQLLYVEPKITSFTGGGTYEKGQTIQSVTLNWAINKTIKTQSINNDIGELEASLRTYTVTKDITTDTTYTLTVNDGKKSASANTAVTFKQKRYWGVSEKTSLANEDILAFTSEFASNRQQTRTFDCSGGKYFYVVIPTQMCSGISFKVGGLSFSAMTSETIQLTNASGYQSSYNVYRCNDIQTGSNISVQVL